MLGQNDSSKELLSHELCDAIVHYLELRARDAPVTHEESKLLDLGLSQAHLEYLQVSQEFFRRLLYPAKTVIRNAGDLHRMMHHHGERTEENLFLISLNAGQEVLAKHFIARGSLTRVEMHPREIFKLAVTDNAVSIVLMHNHPSGSVHPSEGDITSTERLWRAGIIIGIPLYDHIIFTEDRYYSLQEKGHMDTFEKKRIKKGRKK
nr:JAB domain-containing protein [Entomospira culicis]